MAGLTLSPTLAPENWNKQKGVQQKDVGVADALKTFNKAHGNVDAGLLEIARLKTLDEIQERVTALNVELKKSVKTAADEAKSVAAIAKKAEAEYKKVKENSKEATAAAVALAKAAADYSSSVVSAFQSAINDLTPRLIKLEAEARKKEGEEEEEDDDASGDREKELKQTGDRIASVMKLAKTTGPTKPMKFLIGVLKKELFVFVGKAVGGSTPTKIKRLMEAGTQSVTFFRGDCVFENKAHTFVGVNIPTGGFALRIQKALQELTNKRFKIRVRRPTGESDEVGGDDDDDDQDQAASSLDSGAKKPDPGAEFNKRLAGLQARIKQSLVGSRADEIKKLVDTMTQRADQKDFRQAGRVLDSVEALLSSNKEAADRQSGVDPAKAFNARLAALIPKVKAATGDLGKRVANLAAQSGKLAGEKTADSIKEATALLDQIEDLLGDAATTQAAQAKGGGSTKLGTDWANVRKEAIDGINSLVDKIREEYRDERDQQTQVEDAVKKLQALADKLSDALDKQVIAAMSESDPAKRVSLARTATATATDIAKVITDPLMAEIDKNELMPNLEVVGPMKAKLREIVTALR